MSVGITPLAIHVPAMAPMSSRMTMAGVALCMLTITASSSLCHEQRYRHMAIAAHAALAASSENWLPPAMASPPKRLITEARSMTSVASGTSDMAADGAGEGLGLVIADGYNAAKICKTGDRNDLKRVFLTIFGFALDTSPRQNRK